MYKSYTADVEKWKSQLNLASEQLMKRIGDLMIENNKITAENEMLKINNSKIEGQLKTDDEKSKDLIRFETSGMENKLSNNEIPKFSICDEENGTIAAVSNNENCMGIYSVGIENARNRDTKLTENLEGKIEQTFNIFGQYQDALLNLNEDMDVHLAKKKQLSQKVMNYLKLLQNHYLDISDETQITLVDHTEDLSKIDNKVEAISVDMKDTCCQTDGEEQWSSDTETVMLKSKNTELLSEMNIMNQAFKERGETISKLQAHYEELLQKLQMYESSVNKNTELFIKEGELPIGLMKKQDSVSGLKLSEVADVRCEFDNLKEKNSNLDASYIESENMSTSTISRSEEINRLKDLDCSWEEKYAKLRNLALKLKGKVRDLTKELSKEQNEKNELQQKTATHLKTITSLQSQCDKLQDDLEKSNSVIKDYVTKLEATSKEDARLKNMLVENETVIVKLRGDLEQLLQEKSVTETWKKQISAKIQTFRKELEAHTVVKKELDAKIVTLSAELERKDAALKVECDSHLQTKKVLEHSENERKKHSVLNLEMQDYERTVTELSQKLRIKQEEINKLQESLDSQKSTVHAVREQNKILENRILELSNELEVSHSDVLISNKQKSEIETVIGEKENQIHHLTHVLETIRFENEELSTELSKVIKEHQKIYNNLKIENDSLKTDLLGLQQTMRESNDKLRLKEGEYEAVLHAYENYKIRAQSVLRQNQIRDVGQEEKLSDELAVVKLQNESIVRELEECKASLTELKQENEVLSKTKSEFLYKYQEAVGEVNRLNLLYNQLTDKHKQMSTDHNETVRNLKIHAETLGQCYRQQLSELEVRHNREITELQNQRDQANSPVQIPIALLPMTQREEGEGSESEGNSSKNYVHPMSLEKLLGTDTDQEVMFIKKQLREEELKVIHLTALLADAEQDLAKHTQMNNLLKEEIRRHQRSLEREKHAENMEYLKNVLFKFLTLSGGDERLRLVTVLNTILKLSPEEAQKLNMIARGEAPGGRGWGNYFPLWSSPSKP